MNSKIKKCLRRMAEGHLLNQLWENDDPPFGQCFIWYNEKSITLVFGQNKCRELLELGFIQVDHQDNAGNKFYKITDKGIEFINPKKMHNDNPTPSHSEETETTPKTANLQQTLGGDWCIEVYEGKDHRALIYGKTPEEAKQLAEMFCGAINVTAVNSYSTLKAEVETERAMLHVQKQNVTALKKQNEAKDKRIKELELLSEKSISLLATAVGYLKTNIPIQKQMMKFLKSLTQ